MRRSFSPATCLSIRLANGQYAAALVLAAEHSTAEYGRNLVGVLDYLSADKPNIEVFRKRKWLALGQQGESARMDIAWYYPMGFRAVKNRLEIIGQVEILDSDPKNSNTYLRWTGIGERAIHLE